MRRLGMRPAGPTGPTPGELRGLDSLSAREREIAELVTDRKTNDQIAAGSSSASRRSSRTCATSSGSSRSRRGWTWRARWSASVAREVPSRRGELRDRRLEAFAALLELADANPYTMRAIAVPRRRSGARPPRRGAGALGRARELRGIGRGIESRLRELVETGGIAELEELEREIAPDLVGLGRYLGLRARRSVGVARALGVRTADEFREAAAAAGSGP